MGLLYDAVGFGMLAYSRAAFRVGVLGQTEFRLEPGTLIVSTHRRETDVPLICPPLYFGGRVWRYRTPRMSFAARDDMFLPGFFAGFPPDLPLRARKALYRASVARWLPRVEVHPIRSASVARLGEVARAGSELPLAELVADPLLEPVRERAATLGLVEPVRGREVLRGEYADLLWQPVTPADAPSLDGFWARRATEAAEDFRRLVGILRDGGVLVVFPEGRPSPDGEIGPLRRGLAALVRRGRPERLKTIALAYDPLVRGRTRALVHLGSSEDVPRSDVEPEVLRRLRRRTPLTCGQFVAAALAQGREATEAALAAEVEEARAAERPVDPDLLQPAARRRRLAAAAGLAQERPDEVAFLAREYTSAREMPG